MNHMLTIEQIADRLRPILHKNKVIKAIVFGSVARDERTRRSDLDLIILVDTDLRFLDRYDAFQKPIASAFPEFDVDLLIYTPDELEAIKHRAFIRQALKEGQPVYERIKEPA